jgi:hypothetical protein
MRLGDIKRKTIYVPTQLNRYIVTGIIAGAI